MGFWHTGYIEFHEPVGLDWTFTPAPPIRFSCPRCGRLFVSSEELRKHRFEAHPLRRPVLYLDDKEIGTQRIRITRPVKRHQVRIEECDRVALNGKNVAVSRLAQVLSEVSSDVCQISLSKDGVEALYELEIRVASDRDLAGIEEQFGRMAKNRRLDMRAIEDFISGTARFDSAIGYCDGICAYLYGLLAKERARDSSLPYAAYEGKFAKAAEELAPYDRALARTIASVIEFHFNHFQDAAQLAPNSRIALVAERYACWMNGMRQAAENPVNSSQASALELLVTDWETEQIVHWGVMPLAALAQQTATIKEFLNRDLAEYDKVKLTVLLAESYAAAGQLALAVQSAKALRNLAATEKWAEALIREIGEKQ